MKKLIAITIAVMMLVTALSGCAKKEDNVLVIGMELAYPPFEMKDESGNPMGVSVEFGQALGEHLGKEVKIENIAWDGLIPALQTAQVDLVISSMTIQEERKEKIDFSEPYAKALLALLTNKNSGISSIGDLNNSGKKIAVKTGSTGHIFAQKNLPNAELIVLADESACVTEVTQGKADAFIYDQLTIYRNQKNNPDTTNAVYIPFQDVEYWGIGLKKGSELLPAVNEFIDQFTTGGGFDKITDKYLSEEKKAFDEYGFEWFFDDIK